MPIGSLGGSLAKPKRPREDRVQMAAQTAWDSGAQVFVATLPFPRTGIVKGMGHEEIGKELEAIIRMGWKLDTWAAVEASTGSTTAVPLFVRPGSGIR